VDRAILLSHPSYQQKNFEFCIGFLLENGYPITLIFKTIIERLKNLFNNKLSLNINKITVPEKTDVTHNETIKYFAIPYARNISEITSSLINKSNLKVEFRSINKINNFRVHKDRTEQTHIKNMVYRIHCKDCDVSYVGQTRRQLRTKVKEHRNNIKLEEHSVVLKHMLSCNHSFDWNHRYRILDTEPNYNKRLISEMLHIKEQSNSINSQKDTEFLDDAYFSLDNLSNLH